jgi:hypothetical protein
VESRPCLWDKTSEGLKDWELKSKHWLEVSSFLEPNVLQLDRKRRQRFCRYACTPDLGSTGGNNDIVAGTDTDFVGTCTPALSQYPEAPATGQLDTGFSSLPWAHERMLRWFPPFQVASTCSSCSPPDLNSVAANCLLSYYVKWPLPPGDNPTAVNL